MSKPVDVLVLVTEAHGGFGGIAKFNRDAIGAIASYDSVGRVHVLPRLTPTTEMPEIPDKVSYHWSSTRSPARYLSEVAASRQRHGRADLVLCGHINLLPAAVLAAAVHRAPVALSVHGIDVWCNPGRLSSRAVPACVDALISVSELTRDRMLTWCPLPKERTFIVPNALDTRLCGIRGKSAELAQRYGLAGRTVLMTMGRMSASERYKGFDEVIGALPSLAKERPGIAYLAVGDGPDRLRLADLARTKGVADRVIFTGTVSEAEKLDIFGLADAYVMPSRGEGFGIVVLEAMAAGVPVVVSSADGTREAVRDGALGVLVDPDDPTAIREGILSALSRPRGVPDGLAYFSLERFAGRLRTALSYACPAIGEARSVTDLPEARAA